jgi:hypothetical protein
MNPSLAIAALGPFANIIKYFSLFNIYAVSLHDLSIIYKFSPIDTGSYLKRFFN